ncbi:uncharacterized protein LOC124326270 [Daphnia pulicaria]|uniref:uncharacterized protein LOC124326270 n=1 Tax=Daphnia pulicaria TaxID=35523 RepID=UPI001EEAD656|nr:uncharacterized protein LOC124326270 [Daphnia pulicaria]XP_046640956.1 uncharacterized protein LOC124326270 [Daphnia pulicaria]
MKFHCLPLIVAILCISVTHSAPWPREDSSLLKQQGADGIKNGESVKRAANNRRSMTGVPFFEVHDLTGVKHEHIPHDVMPFEVVNIDGHTHDTLPADIIPVEIIQQNSPEVFEVHDLTGVKHEDIPDDVMPFEVVNIDGHTHETLPDGIIPVEIIQQNSPEVFEVHDLTGVEHDDIPDDVVPFEVVNIDGHTHETLPADIIPVEVVQPNSAEVFEVHNLDGVDHDDIPDDLTVFEVVDISEHTHETLPKDVLPVHITPIGPVSAGASAVSTDGSAVFASASASSSGIPAGVTRTSSGMSRIKVVPSYVNRMKFPTKSAVPHVAPAVASARPYARPYAATKVKCRQPDLFPFRGPATGMFKFFSDIVREELSDCTAGGQMH